MKRQIAMMAAVASAAAVAQQAPPQTIQGLENFTLERPAPPRPDTSATSVPTPAPPVIALPAPRAAAPAPTRTARAPAPSSSATLATPTPAAPTPAAVPDIVAVTPVTEPAAAPAETPEASPSGDEEWSWRSAVALLLLAALGGGFALWWRSRGEKAIERCESTRDAALVPEPEPMVEAKQAEPIPIAAKPVSSAPGPVTPSAGFVTSSLRAVIELDFRPVRAGVDTLRVQLDYELQIRNTGPVRSRELFVELAMLSAGTAQDAALAAFFASAPGEPIAESDGLAAGGSARLAGEALLRRDAFDVISAGGKRMVVPLMAARVLGPTGAIVAKAAWLVGIERAGEARMAPLRIDRNGWSEPLGRRDYPTG